MHFVDLIEFDNTTKTVQCKINSLNVLTSLF